MSLLATATVAVLGFTTLSVQANGRSDLAVQGLQAGKAHVADELIVQFRDGATASDKVRALGRVGGQNGKNIVSARNRVKGGDMDLIRVSGANGLATYADSYFFRASKNADSIKLPAAMKMHESATLNAGHGFANFTWRSKRRKSTT